MSDASGFAALPPTALADVLTRDHVMDAGIRPLWGPVPRIAGPAYTVRCAPGTNLMLHAAIHQAAPGSVIVVESGDLGAALAGGNVCAVAQRRGIAGFVLDGVVRDLAEIREMRFPVFARGVVPIPGLKKSPGPVNPRITCGGVTLDAGDVVVADEEGIVVVPAARTAEIRAAAERKLAADDAETLDQWEAAHRAKIEKLLAGQE